MASLKVIVDKDLTGVDFTVEIYLIAIHMLVLHILKTWQWVSILVWIATKFYQCILALSNFVKLKSILEFQKSNSQFTSHFGNQVNTVLFYAVGSYRGKSSLSLPCSWLF